jgi:hypothetical protein
MVNITRSQLIFAILAIVVVVLFYNMTRVTDHIVIREPCLETDAHTQELHLRRTFVLNKDRLARQVVSLGPTYRDMVHLLKAGLRININKDESVHIWNAGGKEVVRDNYKALVLDSKDPIFYVTIGSEKFRKVNGAFYYLLTDDQMNKMGYMLTSLKNLQDNYNSKYGPYPVIIFHSLPQSAREQIEKASNAVIHWVDVGDIFPKRTFPDLPIFKGMNYSEDLKLGQDCAHGRIKWQMGYFNMIRFRSVLLWREPILRFFDYIIQIDSDIDIKRADVDVFEQIHSLNRTFGYYSCVTDGSCTNGLYDASKSYAREAGIEWKHLDKIADPVAYYGNFLIFKTSFFVDNKPLLDYFDAMDNLGGIFFHRWAEQVMIPIALAMHLEYDQLYWIGSKHVELYHYAQPYNPAPQKKCPGVKAEPDCCE